MDRTQHADGQLDNSMLPLKESIAETSRGSQTQAEGALLCVETSSQCAHLRFATVVTSLTEDSRTPESFR